MHPTPSSWTWGPEPARSRALLPVLHGLVHIDLVDVNESMLEAALAALEAVRGACTVEVFSGAAHTHSANPIGAETVVRSLTRWNYQVRRATL